MQIHITKIVLKTLTKIRNKRNANNVPIASKQTKCLMEKGERSRAEKCIQENDEEEEGEEEGKICVDGSFFSVLFFAIVSYRLARLERDAHQLRCSSSIHSLF